MIKIEYPVDIPARPECVGVRVEQDDVFGEPIVATMEFDRKVEGELDLFVQNFRDSFTEMERVRKKRADDAEKERQKESRKK
ncbi:hypothetical protein D3C87_1956030 [compost metagenome]